MDNFECSIDERLIPKNNDVYVICFGYQEQKNAAAPGNCACNHHMLQYIVEGSATFTLNGKSYPLKKYDGFIIPPDTKSSLKTEANKPCKYYYIGFGGKQLPYILGKCGLGINRPIFRYDRDEALHQCMLDLCRELRYLREYSLSITGFLYLFFDRLTSSQRSYPPGTVSRIEKAKQYIRLNLHQNIKVSDVSDYLEISTSQLYRIFKKETDLSPLQYITDLKIEEGCNLIKKTGLALKDVCFELGFKYESHFFMQFKKITGITPTEYRDHFLQSL